MSPDSPDDSTDRTAASAKPLQRPTREVPVSTGRPTREVPVSPRREIAATDPDPLLPGEGEEGARDGKLIARTEELADRALGRLKSEVGLPNVLHEAEGIARTVRGIRSRALAATVGLYVVTASLGVAATAVEGLHDWFMHVAMYVVILSFVIIYVKSHLMQKAIPRAFYAVTTISLMCFFAWVLQDLVPARLVVVDGQAVERPAAELLRVPAVMLLVAASGLMVHWLVLARHDARR